MKIFFCLLIVSATLFNSCSNGQSGTTKTDLSPTKFAEKIKELPSAPVIDVRTPEEFANGHLPDAKNIDWNGNVFDQQIASFHKSKPVFVYCLSGGRSSSAAKKMRAEGFKEVYELQGGIMKWRAANLPENSYNTSISAGLSKQQFEELSKSYKIVLIDFYADWCGPCKKMKPYLGEISNDMSATVKVIRINADENPQLCKELNIEALPTLHLFKNGIRTWENTGYIEKAEVVSQINKP